MNTTDKQPAKRRLTARESMARYRELIRARKRRATAAEKEPDLDGQVPGPEAAR